MNAWYQNELKRLPVEVHTKEKVTAEQLKNMGADVIILAAGKHNPSCRMGRFRGWK